MQHPDVLVSGAGPVGLFAALKLTKAGIPVQIIDDGVQACAHSYALALHPATVQLLSSVGIDSGAALHGSRVRTLSFYDGRERRAAVNLDEAGGALVVAPQSSLEGELERALEKSGVRVQWRHKVMHVELMSDKARVHLTRYEQESRGYVVARTEWVPVKSWTVDVPYVIGADGYGSVVRRSMNVAFHEVAPAAWYAVFEFRSDAPITDEARVAIGENTTDVLWPLGDGWFRWSFQLPKYVDPESERFKAYRQHYDEPAERVKDRVDASVGNVFSLPDERLPQLIAERASWFKDAVKEIGWRTIVRFERRLTDAFGKERCWLAGDAAHLGPPVAVLSLNVGLAEASDLADAIAASRGGQPGPRLQEYEARYGAEWKRLQGMDVNVEAEPDVNPWVLQNKDRLLPCLPAHGANLTALTRQLGLKVDATPRAAGRAQ